MINLIKKLFLKNEKNNVEQEIKRNDLNLLSEIFSEIVEIINQLRRDIQNLKKENEYLENKIKSLEGK